MVNKVTLIGRVGKDPEVRALENGNKVASFSLATSETYKDKSGKKTESTEWHNVVAWKQLADIIERFVNKGDLLYLEGKITTRDYSDKDGNKRYVTEIVAFKMTMLGGKGGKGGKVEPQDDDTSHTATPVPSSDDDDLPF